MNILYLSNQYLHVDIENNKRLLINSAKNKWLLINSAKNKLRGIVAILSVGALGFISRVAIFE